MLNANVYLLNIPMRRQFSHAQAARAIAEGIILKIDYKNHCGIGECAPRPYVTGETTQSVLRQIQDINLEKIIANIDFSNDYTAIESLTHLNDADYFLEDAGNNVICLLEIALFDLVGNYFKSSIRKLLGYIYSEKLPSRSQLAISQVWDLSLSDDEFIKQRGPFHYIKIKMDRDFALNLTKVKKIRASQGESIPIIIDSNMCWDFDMARKHIDALARFNITYYEEPLPKKEFELYRMLRTHQNAKILLDESICTLRDAECAINTKACDAFNIRIAKCGGVIRALKMAMLANTHDLRYQLGTQVAEIGPLIALERQLAGHLTDYFTYEAGQHDHYFADYIVTPMPLINRKMNQAPLLTGTGLGVSLNSNYLKYIKQKIVLS